MESVNTILLGDSPLSLKTLALRLPLVLVTVSQFFLVFFCLIYFLQIYLC